MTSFIKLKLSLVIAVTLLNPAQAYEANSVTLSEVRESLPQKIDGLFKFHKNLKEESCPTNTLVYTASKARGVVKPEFIITSISNQKGCDPTPKSIIWAMSLTHPSCRKQTKIDFYSKKMQFKITYTTRECTVNNQGFSKRYQTWYISIHDIYDKKPDTGMVVIDVNTPNNISAADEKKYNEESIFNAVEKSFFGKLKPISVN